MTARKSLLLLSSISALALALSACATLSGSAPTGSEEKPTDDDEAAMKRVGGKAGGLIVWSSSRNGNHKLFTMKTDGSDVKVITKGDNVDWFPRFSPDGERILFCRSKKGWVSEKDANISEKWDLWTVKPDGSDPKLVVEDATWGSWVGQDTIVFVRNGMIVKTKLGTEKAKVLLDGNKEKSLDGAELQQPEMSPDGKYIAITLRGSRRETGIWSLKDKSWTKTGLGCQINWTPDGKDIYWMNPTGNGGSEVYHEPITDGQPPEKAPSDDEIHFMDMPGRRSHEYFPQLSRDGKWMVWGITQRGHDHDIADYEIYIWEVGTSPETGAARLTFHSSNDRWPDIFIPSAAVAAAPAEAPAAAESAEATTEKEDAPAEEKPTASKSHAKRKHK
jgi:Tol biopolymer transport system component